MNYYYISNQKNLFSNSSFDSFKDWAEVQTQYEVDTETEGFFNHDNKILLLQIGGYDTQWVFDFLSLTKKQRNYINRLLMGPKMKILHNAGFDIKFLWHHNMDINNVYDTMIAELLIHAGRNDSLLMESLSYRLPADKPIGKKMGNKFTGWYSLQRCVYTYCNETYLDKSVRGDILRKGITESVIEYAAKDVKYLGKIKDKQVEKLVELGMANPKNLSDIYSVLGLENASVLAFSHIEYCGMKLSSKKWDKVLKECMANVKAKEETLTEYIWSDDRFKKYRKIYQDLFTPAYKTTTLNWNSPIQKLDLLQRVDPMIDSTSERTLAKFKHKYPIIKSLIEYSKANKLHTAFAMKMPGHVNKKTGRVHTNFWQILQTGRVSCSNPIKLGAYMVMYKMNSVNSRNPINYLGES